MSRWYRAVRPEHGTTRAIARSQRKRASNVSHGYEESSHVRIPGFNYEEFIEKTKDGEGPNIRFSRRILEVERHRRDWEQGGGKSVYGEILRTIGLSTA